MIAYFTAKVSEGCGLVNMFVHITEKSPALAAAALLRTEGLDFSRLFTSPAAESLANDNTMVFAV